MCHTPFLPLLHSSTTTKCSSLEHHEYILKYHTASSPCDVPFSFAQYRQLRLVFYGSSSCPAIPLEAVSPVLSTTQHWESEIDLFWTAWGRVFHLPRRSAKCGSYIHVSPDPNKSFTLTELKKIACGIVFYAKNLNDILPAPRRNNGYCQKNWETGDVGAWYENGSSNDLRQTMERIWKVDNKQELKDFMQDDRRVLWNFEHVVPGNRCTGTVEFRGGRGLRGPNRTKWWIAFLSCHSSSTVYPARVSLTKAQANVDQRIISGKKILEFAGTIQVANDLPSDWRYLNESYSSGQWEDAGDDYDEDSDTSSIVSKSASEYSDSDSGSGDEVQWEYDMERERRECVIQ